MKAISLMTRLEFAAWVSAEFSKRKINIVLSGGSCVSVYSQEKYVSMDLDFVNAGFTKRPVIKKAMEELGFFEENRYFKHPDSELLVEFPPGPLAVGEEPVKQITEIITSTGALRIISPSDCVKDRLAWYYHDNDKECLEQAILVAGSCPIEITEIERWSKAEGKLDIFNQIKHRLEALNF